MSELPTSAYVPQITVSHLIEAMREVARRTDNDYVQDTLRSIIALADRAAHNDPEQESLRALVQRQAQEIEILKHKIATLQNLT